MCNPPEATQPKIFTRNLYKKWAVTLLIEIGWFIWAFLDREERFGRFTEATPYIGFYYYMSITMIFGSLIAGATPAGGGAVAFPVMVLALGVPTRVGRDFSLGIQSFGMSAAAGIIFLLKVPLDYEALIWGTIGGAVGLLIGFEGIAPFLLPPYTKLFFVSLWLAFSVALFMLNRRLDRKVYNTAKEADLALLGLASTKPEVESGDVEVVPKDTEREALILKAKRKRIAVLTSIGLFGGICSSIAGSGLDMATFSILTLYYRESEKVATPTSVVLMAVNAVLGILCRFARIGGPYDPGEELALWKFISVCIPIVVIGAPLGAFVPIILSRHQIAYCLYVLSILQFVTAYSVVRPWSKPAPHNYGLFIASLVTLFGGCMLFYGVAKFGEKRDKMVENTAVEEKVDEESDANITKSDVSVGNTTEE